MPLSFQYTPLTGLVHYYLWDRCIQCSTDKLGKRVQQTRRLRWYLVLGRKREIDSWDVRSVTGTNSFVLRLFKIRRLCWVTFFSFFYICSMWKYYILFLTVSWLMGFVSVWSTLEFVQILMQLQANMKATRTNLKAKWMDTEPIGYLARDSGVMTIYPVHSTR